MSKDLKDFSGKEGLMITVEPQALKSRLHEFNME